LFAAPVAAADWGDGERGGGGAGSAGGGAPSGAPATCRGDAPASARALPTRLGGAGGARRVAPTVGPDDPAQYRAAADPDAALGDWGGHGGGHPRHGHVHVRWRRLHDGPSVR